MAHLVFCILVAAYQFSYVSSLPVAISRECTDFCEPRRPKDSPTDASFIIDCSKFTDSLEMVQCQQICDNRICPPEAVCKHESTVQLQCPEKEASFVESVQDEYNGWEVAVLYTGLALGVLLVLLLIALYINDHIQHRRDLVELQQAFQTDVDSPSVTPAQRTRSMSIMMEHKQMQKLNDETTEDTSD